MDRNRVTSHASSSVVNSSVNDSSISPAPIARASSTSGPVDTADTAVSGSGSVTICHPSRSATEQHHGAQIGRIEADRTAFVERDASEQAVQQRQPSFVDHQPARPHHLHRFDRLGISAVERGQFVTRTSHRSSQRTQQLAVVAQVRHQWAAPPDAMISSWRACRSRDRAFTIRASAARVHAAAQFGQFGMTSGGGRTHPDVPAGARSHVDDFAGRHRSGQSPEAERAAAQQFRVDGRGRHAANEAQRDDWNGNQVRRRTTTWWGSWVVESTKP